MPAPPKYLEKRGTKTNADKNEPAMAPKVFRAYTLPTSRPILCRPKLAILMVRGKVAPMKKVAGKTAKAATENMMNCMTPTCWSKEAIWAVTSLAKMRGMSSM